MDLLETEAIGYAGARAEPIDVVTARAAQLRALLATTTISHQSGELRTEHMSNVLWLATDLVFDIIHAAEAMI